MLAGLQTHFNAPVDPAALQQVRAFGFQLARLDVQTSDAAAAAAYIRDVQQADLRPLVTVASALQITQLAETGLEALDVELRNEPDLLSNVLTGTRDDPAQYGRDLHEAAPAAEAVGYRLWGPAISNLNERGFRFLKTMGPLPDNMRHVSIHRYPEDEIPDRPHKGFRSREDEIAALRALIGDRPFGVSEFGYHRAARKAFKIVPTRTTIEQASAAIRWEWGFWGRMGAEFAVLFQLNDGPGDDRESRFGIRSVDGEWNATAATREHLTS